MGSYRRDTGIRERKGSDHAVLNGRKLGERVMYRESTLRKRENGDKRNGAAEREREERKKRFGTQDIERYDCQATGTHRKGEERKRLGMVDRGGRE